jgi:hypothetical protein
MRAQAMSLTITRKTAALPRHLRKNRYQTLGAAVACIE